MNKGLKALAQVKRVKKGKAQVSSWSFLEKKKKVVEESPIDDSIHSIDESNFASNSSFKENVPLKKIIATKDCFLEPKCSNNDPT